jgi:hypothetical protein
VGAVSVDRLALDDHSRKSRGVAVSRFQFLRVCVCRAHVGFPSSLCVFFGKLSGGAQEA